MTQPPQNPGPGNQPWNGDPNLNPQQPQNPGQFPQSQPSAGQGYGPQGNPGDPGQAGYAGQGVPQGDPYAQGAPQGDPYAQQAAGQPYGATQAFPETPKKGGLKNIGGILLAALLVIGGGWAIWNNMTKEAALEPGKCITISGENDDADHKEVKCDDASQYSYYVAKVNDGATSCGGDYYEYTIGSKRRGGSETTDKTVCLIDQLAVNTCYKELGADSTMSFEVADCGSADFKVTKAENVADAECAAEENAWSWTEPARTYCVGAPN